MAVWCRSKDGVMMKKKWPLYLVAVVILSTLSLGVFATSYYIGGLITGAMDNIVETNR